MSVKRLLDCTPSDLARYTKAELLDAIAGSEGRVLACETIGLTPPLLVDVTNAEYAASLSADILLLNMFDVQHPVINALPKVPEVETVRELKRLTGRVVGITLLLKQPLNGDPCVLRSAVGILRIAPDFCGLHVPPATFQRGRGNHPVKAEFHGAEFPLRLRKTSDHVFVPAPMPKKIVAILLHAIVNSFSVDSGFYDRHGLSQMLVHIRVPAPLRPLAHNPHLIPNFVFRHK